MRRCSSLSAGMKTQKKIHSLSPSKQQNIFFIIIFLLAAVYRSSAQVLAFLFYFFHGSTTHDASALRNTYFSSSATSICCISHYISHYTSSLSICSASLSIGSSAAISPVAASVADYHFSISDSVNFTKWHRSPPVLRIIIINLPLLKKTTLLIGTRS